MTPELSISLVFHPAQGPVQVSKFTNQVIFFTILIKIHGGYLNGSRQFIKESRAVQVHFSPPIDTNMFSSTVFTITGVENSNIAQRHLIWLKIYTDHLTLDR